MAEKRPFRIVLGEGPQKGVLGGSLSRYVPAGAQYEYKPPTVFEQYKILSGVFALLLLAIVLYFLLARRHPHPPLATPVPSAAVSTAAAAPDAAGADPVYVVPVSPPAKH